MNILNSWWELINCDSSTHPSFIDTWMQFTISIYNKRKEKSREFRRHNKAVKFIQTAYTVAFKKWSRGNKHQRPWFHHRVEKRRLIFRPGRRFASTTTVYKPQLPNFNLWLCFQLYSPESGRSRVFHISQLSAYQPITFKVWPPFSYWEFPAICWFITTDFRSCLFWFD